MAAFRFDPAWIRCGSRHAIEFRHLGGIAMLMAVLRSFRKDLSFAIIYCGIVANLAVDLENQSDLVREGPRRADLSKAKDRIVSHDSLL